MWTSCANGPALVESRLCRGCYSAFHGARPDSCRGQAPKHNLFTQYDGNWKAQNHNGLLTESAGWRSSWEACPLDFFLYKGVMPTKLSARGPITGLTILMLYRINFNVLFTLFNNCKQEKMEIYWAKICDQTLQKDFQSLEKIVAKLKLFVLRHKIDRRDLLLSLHNIW